MGPCGMRITWTSTDVELLTQDYPSLSPALLERHSIGSCRAKAHRLKITDKHRSNPVDEPWPMNQPDAAWLAGMIDGEGGVYPRINKCCITTTDEGIRDRLASIPNARIYQRKTKTVNGLTVWDAVFQGKCQLKWLAEQVTPHMSHRVKMTNLTAYA